MLEKDFGLLPEENGTSARQIAKQHLLRAWSALYEDDDVYTTLETTELAYDCIIDSHPADAEMAYLHITCLCLRIQALVGIMLEQNENETESTIMQLEYCLQKIQEVDISLVAGLPLRELSDALDGYDSAAGELLSASDILWDAEELARLAAAVAMLLSRIRQTVSERLHGCFPDPDTAATLKFLDKYLSYLITEIDLGVLNAMDDIEDEPELLEVPFAAIDDQIEGLYRLAVLTARRSGEISIDSGGATPIAIAQAKLGEHRAVLALGRHQHNMISATPEIDNENSSWRVTMLAAARGLESILTELREYSFSNPDMEMDLYFEIGYAYAYLDNFSQAIRWLSEYILTANCYPDEHDKDKYANAKRYLDLCRAGKSIRLTWADDTDNGYYPYEG